MAIYKNKIVLLDTCTFSNVILGKETRAYKEAAKAFALMPNSVLSITDLSYIELMEGCRNLDELKSLSHNLLKYKIVVTGVCKDATNLCNEGAINKIQSEKEFRDYKNRLKAIKTKYLKSIFALSVALYTDLFLQVMAFKFKGHWREANYNLPKLVNYVYKGNILKYNENFYEFIINNNIQFDDVLYETFVLFISSIFPKYKAEFEFERVTNELNKINIRKTLSHYTDQYINFLKQKSKKASDIKLKKCNNIEFLMGMIRADLIFKSFRDKIMQDAISYAVINSGFCKGKFRLNDLVDIYNMMSVGNTSVVIYYFTDDNKWNEFDKIERKTNPDYKQFLVNRY